MSPEAIAVVCVVGSICIMGLCVLVGSLKGELQEANEEMQPEQPACSETICAWCHHGVDHPGGHGICPMHRAEMLADLKELPRCPKTTES